MIVRADARSLPIASGVVSAVVTDPPYHLTTGKRGGSGLASVNLDSPYGRARIGTGFMGKAWDGGDVAFAPETWAEVARVCKPGAHLVAFGGTRTFHRLMCAIEDAGWEIRDTLGWLYGTGFPKSLNLDGAWEGWGTALKPAWEPIILARKPLAGTVAANVIQHGTGALDIDGCRIGVDAPRPQREKYRNDESEANRRVFGSGLAGCRAVEDTKLGRWPANIVHDGSDEAVSVFPSEAGAAAPVTRRGSDKFRTTFGAFAGNTDEDASTFRGDTGSAARFFYCAKASRAERDAGLRGVIAPTRDSDRDAADGAGGENPRNRTNRAQLNAHPTVKPVALMTWLLTLVTPPGGLVLDPFCGSGSTGVAAAAMGVRFCGVDITAEYCGIARLRTLTAEATAVAGVRQGQLFTEEGDAPCGTC